MSPELVGMVGLAAVVVLILVGMPIAIAFIVTSFFGLAYLNSFPAAIHVIVTAPYGTSAYFPFLAIPLFILMGNICYYGNISEDIYTFLHRWVGRFPGGLAMATVGACTAFGAISASSMATSAAVGKVTYAEMRRYKYDARLATGVIAASGGIGSMIPPSIIFILFGILANENIGRLFMAGILPGICEALIYMVMIYVLARRNPALAPRGPSFNLKQRLSAIPRLIPGAVLALTVLGGIYGGVFTPSEAAAIGVSLAFIYSMAIGRLNRENITSALLETGRITAMVFLVLFGATMFNTFMATSGLPMALSESLIGLHFTPLITLVFILLLYVLLGMFMDAMGMMLLTLPIFLPVYQSFEFNLIWIGVLTVRMVELGSITPPLGLHVFVVAGIAQDIKVEDIFRGIIPFALIGVVNVAILVMFPQLSLWLPATMGK